MSWLHSYYLLFITTLIGGGLLWGGNSREIDTVYRTVESDGYEFKLVFNSLPVMSGWLEIVFMTLSTFVICLSVLFKCLKLEELTSILFIGTMCILECFIVLMSAAYPYDPWNVALSGFEQTNVGADQVACVGSSSTMWIKKYHNVTLFYTQLMGENNPWPDVKYAKRLTDCWGLGSIDEPAGLKGAIADFTSRLTASPFSPWRYWSLNVVVCSLLIAYMVNHVFGVYNAKRAQERAQERAQVKRISELMKSHADLHGVATGTEVEVEGEGEGENVVNPLV